MYKLLSLRIGQLLHAAFSHERPEKGWSYCGALFLSLSPVLSCIIYDKTNVPSTYPSPVVAEWKCLRAKYIAGNLKGRLLFVVHEFPLSINHHFWVLKKGKLKSLNEI